MKSRKETWEIYTSSWKAESPAEKRSLYEQSLSADCVYADPLAETRGWDELLGYMAEFHQQIPGGHFVTNEFVEHHKRSLAKWDMLDGSGNKVGEGVSYGEYNDEGKITAMSGFFDVPE